MVISSYLAFFPIAVGMLRGLTSPARERDTNLGWELTQPEDGTYTTTSEHVVTEAAPGGTVPASLEIEIDNTTAYFCPQCQT